MSSLSYSRWVSLTLIWIYRRVIFNNWYSFLISFKLNKLIFYRTIIIRISNGSMVARHFSGRRNPRITYIYHRIRFTVRDSLIYCFRNFFFFELFSIGDYLLMSKLVEFDPLLVFKYSTLFKCPLLNTIVLISSGVRVTWAHHALIGGNYTQTTQGLLLTVILGIYFTILQGLEYYEARFTFADRVYGSTFLLPQDFHGLHVLGGTIFLMVTLFRHSKGEFSTLHHFGFEAAAWYWHFVDVV